MFYIAAFLIGAMLTAILTVLGTIKTTLKTAVLVSVLIGAAGGPLVAYSVSYYNTTQDTLVNFNKRLANVPGFKGTAICGKEGLLIQGTLHDAVSIGGQPETTIAIPVILQFEDIHSCIDHYYPKNESLQARLKAHAQDVVLKTNRLIQQDPKTAKAVGKLLQNLNP